MKKSRKNILALSAVLIILTILITSCGSTSTPNFIKDIDNIQELSVINGTSENEVIEQLNSERNELYVTLNDGSTVLADISWDDNPAQDYNPEGPGPFEFTGTANYNDLIKSVNIDVRVLAEFEIESIAVTPNPIIIKEEPQEEALDITVVVNNLSSYKCEQDVILTVKSAAGDSPYENQKIGEISIVIDANGTEESFKKYTIPSIEEAESIVNDINDVLGDWYIIASLENYPEDEQIEEMVTVEVSSN